MTDKTSGSGQSSSNQSGPRRFNLSEPAKKAEIEVTNVEDFDEQLSQAPALAEITRRKWSLTTWLVASGLLLFAALMLIDFAKNVQWLFQLHPLLGYLGSAIAVFFLVVLIALIIREWRSLSNMNRMADTQLLAREAAENSNEKRADEVSDRLIGLYSKKLGAATPALLTDGSLETLNGLEKLDLIDKHVLAKLDVTVQEHMVQASRDSAVFTAISPFASLDVAVTFWRNLKMIREIAQVYGVAPGWFQTIRLLRRAIGQVVIAGGMEAGDGIFNSLFGSSVAAKLSAKVGEGMVNGMMTARLGIATAELCRPLPFGKNNKPKLLDVAGSALKRVGTQLASKALPSGTD